MMKKIIKNRRDQLWLVISFIIAIIISLLISYLSQNSTFDINYEIPKDTTVTHKGSAVRKETHNRRNYERHYRQSQKEWEDQYSKILENKEDEKNLKPLHQQDTTPKEN